VQLFQKSVSISSKFLQKLGSVEKTIFKECEGGRGALDCVAEKGKNVQRKARKILALSATILLLQQAKKSCNYLEDKIKNDYNVRKQYWEVFHFSAQ
jgi:hypothetical protein